eukprot:CAMPEP_0116113954 /NCGR_PEP_ID=MMETSP0327-20121206/19771_1 /TAXON_ID=44447 /ORGANISM="Pseudo-nitzschia delicatissima, Strain B596" /LENGTH=865 /DNA_ID=CAMNT_0003607321 /DNA_START=47 /DNA_END=2645 /DNA_ORIENTATION=+
MNFSSPSPRFKKHRNEVDSPTSPSDRPLMYLSSSSGSDSFEMETVPIADVESLSPAASKGSGGQKQLQRRKRLRTYLPCVAFLVIAYLSYFFVDYQSGNVQIKTIKEDTPGANAVEPTTEETEKDDSAEHETNNEAEEKKPKNNLILHIGPQKTGSTTLQDAWQKPFGVLSSPLKMDNYHFEYIPAGRLDYFNCDVNSKWGNYINCKASPKLKNVIQSAKRNGQNLLLSDENLDERFPEALRDVIDDDDWDVTVIVMYRRIHQWLHSWYNQIHKTDNMDGKGNVLLTKDGHPYRREHTQWPGEGGNPIPSFSTWYKDFTKYFDKSDLVSKHRSIAFKNSFKPYFNNIVVHNMHQDGDLVTNFMCDTLPDARKSCGLLKKRSIRVPRDNASIDLDYDILAVKARENGILKTGFTRKIVSMRIEKFVKKNAKRIPRVCDMDMMDEIRNWLLDSEKEMLPEAWSEETESYLRDSFDGYLASGKLCDIDFDQVFADEEWIEFFHSIDGMPHLILHIGPQKTGVKTLQHAWDSPKELRNVMEEDNFHYHFLTPSQGMFDCDMIDDHWENCKASQKLKGILADAKQTRKNLVLSNSNLDERFVRALREVINDDHFKVKVVLTYRRIHQWLPIWYNLINKTTNKDSGGNLLLNENGQPQRQPHSKWPIDGGVYVPNFIDWYTTYVRFHSADLASYHPSIRFKHIYEPQFDNIEVYDMSQEGDFVTNFMCQMIPEAFKTCQRLKEGLIHIPLKLSESVEHDIVSVQAYEHGLIDKSLSRPAVVEKVRKYIINAGISLPRICNDSVRDEIHDWLFESEKVMFPDRLSLEASGALEENYNEFYSTGELCDIDIETVLNNKEWIEFFSSLGNKLLP